jgi:hypothetical protein
LKKIHTGKVGKLASAAKCNNRNNNTKVTCVITSERVKDTEREREREKVMSN